ncbi:MAG: peptidoglycan DD-metalloendopeptidase family protein [Ignavibacteria bacterium]|nr:peptidoglycan DD-metalloendopeptidase family protein [Ignavibacteria bacterium]
MKILYLFFIAFPLLISLAGAQQESSAAKDISVAFEKNYNSDDINAVFALFSPEMKLALPLNKATNFLNGLKAQAGKIVKRTFIRYENGVYASYKTQFEQGIFLLKLYIDSTSMIGGLFIKPYIEMNSPLLERNISKLILPIKGEWTVIWGGDTKEQNYHVVSTAQKNAFDLVVTNEDGKSYKTDGKINDDYYAFGKDIVAPCDGEVVLAVDGIKDNLPGEMNPIFMTGNTVVIRTANKEYLFFAHFKQSTVNVKEGQSVKQGQILGQCGNSGNSSEAHLHFHIQNVENMNVATGVKCYFDKLIVNGQSKTDYSPVQKDIIRNK